MKNSYYRGPESNHFDGERFFNPGQASSDKSLLELLRWRLGGHRARWPSFVTAGSGIIPARSVPGLRITCIGHSSLLIQAAGVNLLLDPVWSERASPFQHFGPRRHNPPAVALKDLPPIHAVFVTHNHYDHMDLSTLKHLWKAHRPRFVTPLGNDTILRKGMRDASITAGDWWDSFDLPGEVRVTVVPSYHWSSRSIRDRRMALWAGFYLETSQGSIYCAGDTAYGDGAIFPEIRRRCGSPVVAVLPIGAYAPRWFMQTQHADPQESLQIAQACGASHMLGVHWGTFSLTDEPYAEPAKLLSATAAKQCISAQPFIAGDLWEFA